MSRRVKKATHASQVRIIGGQWRGSRLSVADRPGLRPTPDRVRETLFNWLAMDIAGAAVLDCFAGSGALGLEAASRGASQVILVEKDRQVAGKLHDNCIRLNADSVSVFTVDVLSYLESCSDGFDVVFIDPPYADANLRNQVLDILIKRQLLNDECKVYLEWPDDQHMALESPALHWLKQKTAGHVVYAIAQWRYTG